jgi:hypothetical protein
MAASLGVSRAGSVRATRRVQQRAERREQRYRQAFIEGAEEQSRRALGTAADTRGAPESAEAVSRRYLKLGATRAGMDFSTVFVYTSLAGGIE